MLKKFFTICFCIFWSVLIFTPCNLNAQMHSSVSLESQVYYILEQAELRGLITVLSGTRPYTRSVVIAKINEILSNSNSKRLGGTEREILKQYLESLSKPKPGMDWKNGMFSAKTDTGIEDISFSANIGVTADIEGSLGAYANGFYYGAEAWFGVTANGDLGNYFSYQLIFMGGLVRAPRIFLGKYNTYYEGYDGYDGWRPEEYANQEIDVYSEPLTH